MKRFKSNNREWLIVKVPDGAISIVSYMGYLTYKLWNEANGWDSREAGNPIKIKEYLAKHNPEKDYIQKELKLPPGNWKLISTNVFKMEEVECVTLVDGGWCSTNGCNLFEDYQNETNTFDTSKESWHSLLTSLECYEVNPIEYPDIDGIDGDKCYEKLKQWQYMQANVGTFVLLGEVKD